MYEKRGTERVGRGRRKEAIAEILKVIEIDYVEEHFIDESIILVVLNLEHQVEYKANKQTI